MGTQSQIQTSQPSEKTNTDTYQHWAARAIIGEDTRRLLIAWGKVLLHPEVLFGITRAYTRDAECLPFWTSKKDFCGVSAREQPRL